MPHSRRKLIALALFASATVIAQDAPKEKVIEIKMTAQRYTFTPKEIKIARGSRVRLSITAVDADHGFKLDAFHVSQTLPKGETVTIEFLADRAGEFPFQCSHVCGLGH